ncbi:alpha-galactosidase [Asaia krungthepensis]|uniref:Enterotoxin n=1 Tax=Asaia krungthepensis NRIC 0535 TaxID=1307925 RepID=A0ABQ0Q3X9_9PROT|nr:enterotoxin [Asaia krungthepensis]GBQ90237.1 enterotoxin [Asaia krungthepensis NRIC 0535]
MVFSSCTPRMMAWFGLVLGASCLSPVARADERAVLAPSATQEVPSGEGRRFGNDAISLVWSAQNGHLNGVSIEDAAHGRTLGLRDLFTLVLKDGSQIGSQDLKIVKPPGVEWVPGRPQAARGADRLAGMALVATLADPKGRFTLVWRVEQRSAMPYLRESIAITPAKAPLALDHVAMLEVNTREGEVVGDVTGAPILIQDAYFGIESPLAETLVFNGRSRMTLAQALPVQPDHTLVVSAAAGVVRHGQGRRDFQIYLEHERSHPYRPFLNYNSWYDIGYFTPYTQKDAETRIRQIGDSLVRAHGVKLDSFLFDDGWDDRSGFWRFSKDFPQGFKPLMSLAGAYGAAPGVWLSPWGGYSTPKKERVTNGAKAGLETRDGGFDLSAPRYYRAFHEAVLALVKQDGINQFKFDGTGNADHVAPGSVFNSDFDAAIHLIDDIYAVRPDMFINLTTGTYPSPFWLRHADSIWRGGEDDMLRGVGTRRQQWITYRDSETYENIVVRSPFFPLNSLMLHGIIYAQKNQRLNDDPGHDFPDEVHSFFATGTDEQELYVTPDLLKPEDWQVIAESAQWARKNAGILRDTHWVGGDPGRLEPYGWAAWAPEKAILTLRNPDRMPRQILIEPGHVLELPDGAASHFTVHRLWGRSAAPTTMDAAHPELIALAPFEVMTLELTPSGGQGTP